MKRAIARAIDLLAVPFVAPSAYILKLVRRFGVGRLPLSKAALVRVGVFPILDHYYEPRFDYRSGKPNFHGDRKLPGIDWNEAAQLEFLDSLRYADELELPTGRCEPPEFGLDNNQFNAGDAEYWYQLVRAVKPRRIFEIGSGNSTLIAIKAIERNRREDPSYECKHVCIEPYEMPWLEKTGVTVIRSTIEKLDMSFFAELGRDDVLFIDSSHVIRPGGDLTCEYLQLLPTLNVGVMVHIHDIFSPREYPEEWVVGDVRLWNEQYLLEAFLTHNDRWKIVGALNYLRHNHFERLQKVAPYLTQANNPGSFYLRRVA